MIEIEEEKDNPSPQLPTEISINYIKNPLYREIYCDGAIGGLTTRGKLNINFYAERLVIPKSEKIQIENAKFGKRIAVGEDSKEGIVREMEFGVYMDVQSAKDFRDWLEVRIKEFEELNKLK